MQNTSPFLRLRAHLPGPSLLIILSLGASALSGCTSSYIGSLPNQLGNVLVNPQVSTTPTAQDKLVISTVSVSSAATPVVNIFMDTVKSTTLASAHCNTTSGNNVQTQKPCVCQFSWNEVNPNGGASSSIPRTIQTDVSAVQNNLITCPAPGVYTTEIIDGTQIAVTVVAGPANSDLGTFSVNSVNIIKNTNAVTGSFQDSQGRVFDNIVHYACYQKFTRGMWIQNKIDVRNNTTTGEAVNALFATSFCTNPAVCSTLPASDFSSQAYYYNLYIRNSDQGDINLFNDGYVCPTVKESLNSNNTIGTSDLAWPRDETFALSLSPTTTFSVGVVSNSKLENGNNPTASASSCFTANNNGGGGNQGSSGIISSCLGFAAKINADGTCPFITDSLGQLRATYRLRRFIALYPRVFDTTGAVLQNQPQSSDTIYVLDRPVKGPVTSDPRKPYTMRGPKPCPFAFFDRKGTTSTFNPPTPSYVGSSNPKWTGRNIDGIEFPNFDSLPNSSNPSCSSMFPILSKDGTHFNMITVNKDSPTSFFPHLYVRPVQAFSSHYEEDTDFQACALQAIPVKDPPLHFSRDPISGNVAWCAETYPTQNVNVKSLDPPTLPSPTPSSTVIPSIPTGNVSPYTSHTVRNTVSSTCSSTLISLPVTPNYNYASAAGTRYAQHRSTTLWDTRVGDTTVHTADQTCDRTVTTAGLAWSLFPLLAPATDIEQSISTDSSYMCLVTYDNSGSKTNKATPSDGCCDKSVVKVQTGSTGPSVGHLEPDFNCSIPAY